MKEGYKCIYTIPGDITGDERVDTFDMIFMRRHLLKNLLMNVKGLPQI